MQEEKTIHRATLSRHWRRGRIRNNPRGKTRVAEFNAFVFECS